jgi:hypothetical protein
MADSTNKAPNKVVIDLLQHSWAGLRQANSGNKERLENIKKWSIVNRLPKDAYPSIHCVIDTVKHDQRGMKQQVSYDEIQLEVIHYSRNYANLWNAHQSIKQILVGNNKVDATKNIPDTGVEIINVVKTEFFEDLVNREKAVYYFVMDVVVKLQESYLS